MFSLELGCRFSVFERRFRFFVCSFVCSFVRTFLLTLIVCASRIPPRPLGGWRPGDSIASSRKHSIIVTKKEPHFLEESSRQRAPTLLGTLRFSPTCFLLNVVWVYIFKRRLRNCHVSTKFEKAVVALKRETERFA